MELAERQKQLLRAIVEKYIETAEPVGSETIEKEAGLGVSPATIRNEMVKLTKSGFLKQLHTSAGRIPTSTAIKFYVNQLMKEKTLPVKDEAAIKEEIWDYRYQYDKLIRCATKSLADYTKALALATTDDGEVYSAGTANILDIPEFYDIDLTKSVLSLLDRFDTLNQLFSYSASADPIQILLGDEIPIEYLEPVGFVYTRFAAGRNHQGVIGVVGPARLNYPVVIPTVRYFGNLINDLAAAW